jgi:hypothetical protein
MCAIITHYLYITEQEDMTVVSIYRQNYELHET